MALRRIIKELTLLKRKAAAVEASLQPKEDWGDLVNVDACFDSMQSLYNKISEAPISQDQVEDILCDGLPPKIQLNEAPIRYTERGKRWCSDIRERIVGELEMARDARTHFWTKARGVTAILAIIVSIFIWIASRMSSYQPTVPSSSPSEPFHSPITSATQESPSPKSLAAPSVTQSAVAETPPIIPTPSVTPTPTTTLRSRLLIRGSYNEVYFYWGDVAVRKQPFTVTAEGEHTHIQLPNGFPVDIEFDGHDNVAWCRDREMVGVVHGNGLRGNRFEVREESVIDSPTPSVSRSASQTTSRTEPRKPSAAEFFKLAEEESATTSDGALKIFVVKIFNNKQGVDLSLGSLDNPNVFEALIGKPLSIPGHHKYTLTLRGFDGDAAVLEVSCRD